MRENKRGEMSSDRAERINNKRDREKKVIGQMIAIYCRKKHGSREGLCSDCREILEYANARVDDCPFMETKTFCSDCKVHCYREEMRRRIREIMRCAGPRMLLYHPILLLKHILISRMGK